MQKFYLSYLGTHLALVLPAAAATVGVVAVVLGVHGLRHDQAAVAGLARLADLGRRGRGGRRVAAVAVQPRHVLTVKAAILQTCNKDLPEFSFFYRLALDW